MQHVIPINDAIEHEESRQCWCKPTFNEEDDLLIHHSADGRELQEPDYDGVYPPAVRH